MGSIGENQSFKPEIEVKYSLQRESNSASVESRMFSMNWDLFGMSSTNLSQKSFL